MTDACVLDLLAQPKPLKDSCFSESQIDLLFQEWRKFMYEHFKTALGGEMQAWQQVDALYNSAISVQQKYDALRFNTMSGPSGPGASGPTVAINKHETEWVLDDGPPSNSTTSPFIAYLRQQPDLMAELRMSFKPKLHHQGPLETSDFVAILLRYVYWLRNTERSLNVIGVADSSVDPQMDAMVDALTTQWAYNRYHLAVLRTSNGSSVAVLIDKDHGTFDYYDPLGHAINIGSGADATSSDIARQVLELFNTAISLNTDMMQRRDMLAQELTKPRRGFQPSPSRVDCGMFILLFVHLRVIENHTLDQIAALEVTREKCEALKSRFFTIPQVFRPSETSLSMRYGAYDVRLAAWNFIVYVEQMLLPMVTNQTAANVVKQRLDIVKRLCVQPGDYNQIRFVCVELQSDLIKSLPATYLSYSGSNLWVPYLNQIVNDPLTKHLRSGAKKGRSRNTVRRSLLTHIYERLMEWTKSPVNAADVVQVQGVLSHIVSQYLFLLNFDKPAKPEFVAEMSNNPLGFLVETSRRQETVSFGVALLRQLNDIVRKHFVGVTMIGTELDTYKPLEVPEIHSQEERVKLEQVMTKCDVALKRAYEIIKESVRDQLTVIPGRPLVTPLGQNMIAVGPTGPPGPPGPMGLMRQLGAVDRLPVYTNEQVMPWTFPIVVTDFAQRYGFLPGSEYLSPNNVMTRESILQLASNTAYMDAFIRGIDKLQLSGLTDVNFTIVCDSVVELRNATTFPQYKATLTDRINRFRTYMLSSSTVRSKTSEILARFSA